MICRLVRLLASVPILLPQVAAAQQPSPLDHLLVARSLHCVFDQGTQGVWDGGELTVEQASFGDEGTLTFDAINASAGTARIIGTSGAADGSVTKTFKSLTFVERTLAGNLNITTVFGAHDAPGSGRFVAVQSRHQNLFGGPLSSQFHGTCTVLE